MATIPMASMQPPGTKVNFQASVRGPPQPAAKRMAALGFSTPAAFAATIGCAAGLSLRRSRMQPEEAKASPPQADRELLAADLPWVSLWRIFMASAVLMCLGCSSLFGGQAEMDQALLLFLAWSIVRLFLRHHGP
ncbi:unnamed protein product [Durusdinium trenchii]|uniref:Uncharacterized protein n=1 Tax=Durusdinium trenchii TaxID=1381693 RepID=A0ABP0LRQ4_9DINO